MEEIWKPIRGYYGLYEISSKGRVRALIDHNKKKAPYIKKTEVIKGGYLRVQLTKYGQRKRFMVHRLVAEAFIPNPNGWPQINHIDERKNNNNVSNLEWCSRSYNIRYGTRTEKFLATMKERGRKRAESPVLQYTIDGNLVNTFKSASEASRFTQINHSHISECARGGNRRSAGGFKWKYADSPQDVAK